MKGRFLWNFIMHWLTKLTWHWIIWPKATALHFKSYATFLCMICVYVVGLYLKIVNVILIALLLLCQPHILLKNACRACVMPFVKEL